MRSCEIGTVMFGRRPDGSEVPAALDLVRPAIPRRTYTQSHIDYVIEVCEHVARGASGLTGYRILDEPATLRHFLATFEPLGLNARGQHREPGSGFHRPDLLLLVTDGAAASCHPVPEQRTVDRDWLGRVEELQQYLGEPRRLVHVRKCSDCSKTSRVLPGIAACAW